MLRSGEAASRSMRSRRRFGTEPRPYFSTGMPTMLPHSVHEPS
jgi:hypothetical protein